MTAPEPGPLGEEALRLVEAARDWAERTFPEVDAHLATGSPECRWCPLCRAVSVLRGEQPEVTERLAGAVTAAAGALAGILDALTRPEPTTPPAATPPAATPPAATPPPSGAAAPGEAMPAASGGPLDLAAPSRAGDPGPAVGVQSIPLD